MGNMSYSAFNQYKQNTVFSATPEELTLMLYDGAIKFMNIAKYSIENKDIQKSHEALIRAQDIIIELNASLNMDYDVANNLRSLYNFVMDKLIDANIDKDEKNIEEALDIVTDLRNTWKEAVKEVKKKRYKNK